MNKQNFKIVLFVTIFISLGIFVIYNQPDSNSEVFSTDAFYTGTKSSDIDYKAIYDSLYVGLAPGSGQCRNEMIPVTEYVLDDGTKAETCMAGRFQWIVNKTISNSSEIGSGAQIMPYGDGDLIVSPGNLQFINSNIIQDNESTIYMEAILANKYVIRWDNIKSWWCHIGKDNTNKHSIVVGKGGIYSSCSAGYVIGQANADTVVSFYKLDADGNKTEIDAVDVFGNF